MMDEGGLGSIVYEQRVSKVTTAAVVLVGLGLVAGAVATGEPLAVAGAVLIALGFLALGAANVASGHRGYRCHERGIARWSVFGERTLAYADVEVFQYQATAVLYAGVHTRTNVRLRFVPAGRRRGVEFTVVLAPGQEAPLERVRDLVAAVVAGRLADRLASEPEVPWTDSIRLSHDGIRYAQKKHFGLSTTEAFVSFSERVNARIESGFCSLVAPARKEVLFTIPTSAPNFFPGFALMCRLADRATGD
jgi:hypothetical protein